MGSKKKIEMNFMKEINDQEDWESLINHQVKD